MTSSYLAVLSHRGLEMLVEETEHAWRFLARRCYDRPAHSAALCWATLDRQDAETIHTLTRLGLYTAALWRLNTDARQLGSLPPTRPADDVA